MHTDVPAYGLWSLVIINSAIFIMFAFTFFKPKTKRDWRTFSAFSAFLVALFTEMYGFPLTIYVLSGWLQSRYPNIDWFSHDAGHLLEELFGWKANPHFGPFHLLSFAFIIGGFLLISAGWKVLYEAQRRRELATTGVYASIRHPQYVGFVLIMFGFLLQWPTLLTLAMFPVLVFMYVRLARIEEREAIADFGDTYRRYKLDVPRFIPRLGGPKRGRSLLLQGAVAEKVGLQAPAPTPRLKDHAKEPSASPLRSPAMSFTTLLVHVEADPTTDPRLTLAVDLANRFNAKLIGVGAELYTTTYFGGFDNGAGYLIVEQLKLVETDLKRSEEKFHRAAAAVREGWDWRASAQFRLNEIAAHARAADLVVTSRSGRQGAANYNFDALGMLVLQTGRPVLVAPPDAARLSVASVVVAWKDTRESRRAVSDALPFLQRAKTVQLVEICDSEDAAPAAKSRLTDVADHLLRHGVKATVSVDVQKNDAAAPRLLDIAEHQKADLIVAGGYGHSRLQEWVFGGFTRALLAQTARAVLFSH